MKALLWTAALAIPLLGAWLASSWAAYHNAPSGLAAAIGALVLVLLPLLWEAWAHRPGKKPRLSWQRPRWIACSTALTSS